MGWILWVMYRSPSPFPPRPPHSPAPLPAFRPPPHPPYMPFHDSQSTARSSTRIACILRRIASTVTWPSLLAPRHSPPIRPATSPLPAPPSPQPPPVPIHICFQYALFPPASPPSPPPNSSTGPYRRQPLQPLPSPLYMGNTNPGP